MLTSALIVVAALGVVVLASAAVCAPAPPRRDGSCGRSSSRDGGRDSWRPTTPPSSSPSCSGAYPLLPFGEPWLEIVAWTIIGAVVLVPVGFLVGALRLRLRRSAIAQLALELDGGTDPQRLRDALRVALGDPGLDLYLRGPRGHVDDRVGAAGRPPRRGRPEGPHAADRPARTHRGRGPRPRPERGPGTGGRCHRRAPPGRRERAPDRSRPGPAGGGARVAARLIEAGDRERRRIERDLHDGAQQRLIAVALCLRQARHQALATDARARGRGPPRRRSRGAQRPLCASCGSWPAGSTRRVLTEEGLRPAVAGLARRAAVPVDARRPMRPAGRGSRGGRLLHRRGGAHQRDEARPRQRGNRLHLPVRRAPQGRGQRRRRWRRRLRARIGPRGPRRPTGRPLRAGSRWPALRVAARASGRRSRASDRGR